MQTIVWLALGTVFAIAVGLGELMGMIENFLMTLEDNAIAPASGDSKERLRKVMLTLYTMVSVVWAGLCIVYGVGESQCENDSPTTNPTSAPAPVISGERDALMAFYNQANGVNWNDNTNWNSNSDICTWYGVTCDNKLSQSSSSSSGKVTELKLKKNNMFGTIATEIGFLTQLSYIDFDSNSFSGTIPTELGLLASLRHLELDANRLTGPVPSQLGSLDNLKEVYVQSNNLSGTMPLELCARRDNLGGELDTLIADCSRDGNEFGYSDIVCTCCTTCF